MLGLKVASWFYLLILIMGRLVNFNTNGEQSHKARFIDNIMIIGLFIFIYFLSK